MATEKKTQGKPRAARKTAKEVEADVAAKAEELAADTRADTAVAKRTGDGVLAGLVATEHIDPDAERALKDPDVVKDYNAAKETLREAADLDGRRTESLKTLARQLTQLRSHFKQPGSRGRRKDWGGMSVEYRALAKLLYEDLGIPKDVQDSTQRSVRHHIEDVKRELVPQNQWEHFGIQALTRGQRQALATKSAKAQEEMEETATETAAKAATGAATGAQLVALAKRIDAGLSVYSTASLRVMTPAQRKTFREQVQDANERTGALLKELDDLEM